MSTPPETDLRDGDVPAAPFTDRPGQSRLRDVVPADPWQRVRAVLLAGYLVGYVVWFYVNGIIIDRISVTISVVALLVLLHVGRSLFEWFRLAIDLLLYAAMWWVYDETRGIADRLGAPVQIESTINIDRFLFFGTDPNVWMQQTFYSADHVYWYDIAASIFYYTHFVVPIAVIVFLWVSDRREWVRFMSRFATVLFVACISFVVLPTVPPWMAAGGDPRRPLDALEPLARPAGRGWQHLGLHGFVHAWETGRDWSNQVAAMPSLHAAFALFVVVFFLPWIPWRPVKVLVFVFPLGMAVALVYLAEHYVIDVLAGWAVVGLSFLVWNRIERSTRRRRAGVSRRALDPLVDASTMVGA
ncbi:MAG: phosphatase PAP2 family protein [Ilumatobacteraceae bacterium]